MHRYAERLLNRYQKFNDRGLNTEVRYANGQPYVQGSGVKGSVVLDVVEGSISNPTAIYDYKFNGAQLTQSRIAQIQRVGGFASNVPINEIHYPR